MTTSAVMGVDSSTQSCKVEIRDLTTGQDPRVGRGPASARLPAVQ